MAQNALRTLIIACKNIAPDTDLLTKNKHGIYNFQKSELTLIAVLGVRDNPRPQAAQAILDCKKGHIKVRMITGDNIITARAVATELGIITPGD